MSVRVSSRVKEVKGVGDKRESFVTDPLYSYSIDEVTAEFYSAILDQLKKQGTPIPTNDIWIAATALQQGLPLYTFDKHFEHIAGMLFIR